MSTEVDTRVVEMRFDNAQFEKNVAESLKTLQSLKKNIENSGLDKSVTNIEKSLNNFTLKNLSNAVSEGVKDFNLLSVAGVTAMVRISDAAIDMAKKVAISVGELQAMRAGFSEYETQINAIQTILSNTKSKGTTIDQVNKALDELNTYADKTIYNFTQMTDNIGKFTAAGVGLEESVAAIKGISNLAALSGSDAAQAGRAMYNLSQALSLGTLKLQDWNSVVNAGMGGEIFQESLKETARVHGVAVDQMIAEEGSFRESLSKGWITAEILTETLAKFTGDLSEQQLRSLGYTEEQIKAIIELGKDANDAATKVKTITQLFDTLNEARQSGWTQSWKIIVGDLKEARDTLTDISYIFNDIIEEQANARNSFLEAVFGGDNGAGSAQEVEKQVTEVANHTKEELQRIVDEVWAGNWGNGEERWAALAEAGYDPVLVQSLVDLTEWTENNQIDWENLTEEQLLSVGATEEQIEEFRRLNNVLAETSEQLDKVEESENGEARKSGRELAVKGLMNVLNALVDVYHIVGEAWNQAFPPVTAETVYNLIAKFHDFTENLKLNQGQTNALRIGFKGVFDIIGIVVDVFGALWTLVKNIFGIFTKGDGEKSLTILQRFAIIGAKISKFRSWLKDGQKLEQIVKTVTDKVEAFIDFLKELKNVLKNLFFGGDEGRVSAFEKLSEWADKLKTKIRNINFKPFTVFIEKIQAFFEKKGISIQWLEDLKNKLNNLTLGNIIDSFKNKIFGLFSDLGLDDFHPLASIVGWFEELTGIDIPNLDEVRETIRGKINEIIGWFRIDDETGEAPIVSKVQGWLDSFKTVTFTAWNNLLTGVRNRIILIKGWFVGNDVTGEPGIVGKFKNWINSFTGINFDETWSTITENINDKIQEIVKWFSGDDIGETPGIIDRIGEAIGIIRNWFDDKANFVINTEWFTGLKEAIQSFVNWILGKDKSEELNLIVGAGFGIGIDPRQLEDNLTVENGPLQIFMNAIDELKKWYEETDWEALFSSITTSITNKIDAIAIWFSDIKTAFENSAIGTSIKEKFNELIENFEGIDFKEVYNNFVSDFKSKIEGIKQWINNIGDKFNFKPLETIKNTFETLSAEWAKMTADNGEGAEQNPIVQFAGFIKEKLEDLASSQLVQQALKFIEKLPGLVVVIGTGLLVKKVREFFEGITEAIDTFLGGSPSENMDKKANAILKVGAAIGIISLSIGYLVEVFKELTQLTANNNITDDDIEQTGNIIGQLSGVLIAMNKLSGPLIEWQGKEGDLVGKGTVTKGSMFKLGSSVELVNGAAMMAMAEAVKIMADVYREIIDVVKDPLVKPEHLVEAGLIIEALSAMLAGCGAFQNMIIQVGGPKVQAMFSTMFGVNQGAGDLLLVGAIKGLWSVVRSIIRLKQEDGIQDTDIKEAIGIVQELGKLLEELAKWSHIKFGVGGSGSKGGGFLGLEFGATASSGFGTWEYAKAIGELVECIKELNTIKTEDIQEAEARLSEIMAMLDLGIFGYSVGETAEDVVTTLAKGEKVAEAAGDAAKDIKTVGKIFGGFGNSFLGQDIGSGLKVLAYAKALTDIIDALDKLKNINVSEVSQTFVDLIEPFAEVTAAGAIATFLTFGQGLASIGVGLMFMGAGGIISGIAELTREVTSFLEFLIDHGKEAEEVLPVVKQLTEDIVTGMVNGFLSEEAKEKYGEVGDSIGKAIGLALKDNLVTSFLGAFAGLVTALFNEIYGAVIDILVGVGAISEKSGELMKAISDASAEASYAMYEYGANSEEYKEALNEVAKAKQAYHEYIHPQNTLILDYDTTKTKYVINYKGEEREFDTYEECDEYIHDLILRDGHMSIFDSQGNLVTSYDIPDSTNPGVKLNIRQQAYVGAMWQLKLEQSNDIKEGFRKAVSEATGVALEDMSDTYTYGLAEGEYLDVSINGLPRLIVHIENGEAIYEAYSSELALELAKKGIVLNMQSDTVGISLDRLTHVEMPEDIPEDYKETIRGQLRDLFKNTIEDGGTDGFVTVAVDGQYINFVFDADNNTIKAIDKSVDDLLSEGLHMVNAMTIGANVGENYDEGIEKGLDGGKSSLSKKAQELAEFGVVNPVNTTLKIQSPSGVGEEQGMYYDQGLANGVVGYAILPADAVRAMAQGMIIVLDGYKSQFYNAALDCVHGLILGFSSSETLYNAANAATQLANTMLDATKTTLGIASPAKAFIEVGELSGEGIAVGLYNSMRGVVRAAGEMGTRAVSAVKYSMGNIGNSVMPLIGASASLSPVIDIRNLQNAKQTMARTFENGFWPTELMEQTQALKDEYNRSIYYDGFDDTNVLGAIYALNERIDQLDSTMSSMSMVLDSGALVGQLTPKVDKSLGAIARRKARGV